MNTPRFLIGAALVFWGWQTGLLWIGVLMALALEAAHFIATRWEFSITDLNRIYDLCAVLFLGGAAYCFVTRNSTNEVMNFLRATSFTARGQAGGNIAATAFFFFQWWPMFFFPIAAAQAYGTQSQIPFSTFSWYLRRKAAQKEGPSGGINIAFLYLAIVLMATSVTNRPGIWFYLGFCGLAAWALWAIRPARFSPVLWLCITLAVMKAGFWGHNGIRHLQATIENRVSGWVGRMQRGNLNKAETTTGIGQIGEVKASGGIVLRVDPEDSPAPRLLRDASYNTFRSPNWYAVPKAFANVAAEGESATWRIMPDKEASNSVKVAMYMTQGRAVLPVPNGTAVLEGVPVGEVLTNGFGVIRANEGPGLIEFRALYGPGATIDFHTNANDFVLMDNERPALQQVLAGLDLEGVDEREKIQRIDTFFLKNFEYSTYQSIGPPRATLTNTPTGEFLLKTRKGHCEYFATATVLLLREAGIAARYATGYSVQEKEKDGPLYLVRQRHAHAWCLYYDSQQQAWVDFDTTPASWRDVEFAAASPWENFSDFWSNLGYKFSRWRWLSQRADTERYLGAVLIGLVIYLLWRLFYGKERTKRKAAGAQAAMVVEWPGQDSEFFLVEKRLAGLGFVRPEGETFLEWMRRLQRVPGLRLAKLETMLNLHYRYRFDPRGINAAEREALRKEALAWLEESKEMKAVVAG